jgi:hypothetical protein
MQHQQQQVAAAATAAAAAHQYCRRQILSNLRHSLCMRLLLPFFDLQADGP